MAITPNERNAMPNLVKRGQEVITPAGNRGIVVWSRSTPSGGVCTVEFEGGRRMGFGQRQLTVVPDDKRTLQKGAMA